jgi:4-hydroxy-tetrahydrodipicolinate synthase
LKLEGAYTALVTPMRGDGIDVAALERLVEDQIAGGIDGLVPCGTTGESPTLSHAEHLQVVRIVIAAARGRVPVLAGAGSNSTQEACDLARACKELGADGTLQITPYYNKPTQSGLVAHFTAIAEASGLPMVVYNVPGRTCVDLEPITLARLAEHPLVVGVKEATADMHRAARIRELCGEGFSLLSGDDFTVLPFLAVGGNGVISVGSNLFPGLFARLCRAARENRWDEARALHYRQLPLSRALFSVTSPEPVKAAMAMLGRCEPTIRLPLLPLPDDHPTRAELRRVLDTLEGQ